MERCYCQGQRWLLLGFFLVLYSSRTLAALETAEHHIEHGYALLLQAQAVSSGTQREHLLQEAIDAFKQGYQHVGQTAQVQALLGAAQGYLLMQTPRRRFPFLWQAAPLQRAEKSLQHALVLQPHNAAAALLLGLVYWRQATAVTPPLQDTLAQSQAYLERAAAAGIPVRSVTEDTPRTQELPPPLHAHDRLIIVRAIDSRGTGQQEDVLLVYQPVAGGEGCFGVVVAAGIAYPLVTDPVTGAMVIASTIVALTIVSQPAAPPVITVRTPPHTHPIVTRFVWEHGRFVPVL
jgi:hypothetical protein